MLMDPILVNLDFVSMVLKLTQELVYPLKGSIFKSIIESLIEEG